MKTYFIERMDMGLQSSRGTEFITYNYAKWMQEHGMEVEMLNAYYIDTSSDKPKKDRARIKARYRSIGARDLDFVRLPTPIPTFSFVHIKNLPDGRIYFPYSFYDNLTNLLFKRNEQIFVLSGLCLEVHTSYPAVRGVVDLFVKVIFKLKGKNIYFHSMNPEQKKFMLGLGLPKENIIYVPIFIDYKDVTLLGSTSKKLKVMHIGGTVKNSGVFVGIFDKLLERDEFDRYEFYFIGSRQPEELMAYAQKYDNVKVLGRVVDDDKWKYLRQSDVLVIPALEAFPAVSLEALESGPVIVSRPNSAIGTIKDLGANLFLLESDSPEEFIKAFREVAKLKKDAKRFMDVKKKNKEICKENFSRERVLEQMGQMFNTIERLSSKNG